MIERVVLQDFKTHKKTEITLGRLTVLVGPNGSGKSSVLLALDAMCRSARTSNLTGGFSGICTPAKIIRQGGRDTIVKVILSDSTVFQVLIHPETGPNGPEVKRVDSTLSNSKTIVQSGKFASDDGRKAFHEIVPKSAILRHEASRLAMPAIASLSRTMETDGYGLANSLAHMLLGDPVAVQDVVGSTKRLVPSVEALRIRPSEENFNVEGYTQIIRQTKYELFVDFAHAKGISAGAVSEGTLLLIGLLTVLHGPDRPRMLFLDDLDRGLHPRAQRELLRLLRAVLDTDPELQIVATTHSPYLVDELEASEVWVCALDAEGVSHVRNLATHPRADRLLDVLTTGELLSAEGDDWVLAGDP